MNENKVALITAAAGTGIGAAIARQLAEDGMDIVVTDAHERRCREYADKWSKEFGRDFPPLPLDVTDFDAVESVVEVMASHGRLDVLVNNAGWNKIEPIAEMQRETWQHSLNVDLNGTFNCMRHALPHMIAAGSGAIVNISSIAAWETSTDHGAAYSAAKAGVHALTRVAAAENGKHGIRVNAVAPGLIYNEFLRKIYPDEFFDSYAENRSLVGRVGQPADIANMVSFLVSDKAGYINGEVYGVSGGVYPMPDSTGKQDSPLFWTVEKLLDAYRRRELSPVEVTEEALRRIDQFDPELHAFLGRCDELAREQAVQAEKDYKNNEALPLSGVPVSIKDTFHIKDHVATFGSLAYRTNVSSQDSGVVTRLRRAGCVFTGKTNTSEFAQSATAENNFFDDCHNPWDLSRTCGGSSGVPQLPLQLGCLLSPQAQMAGGSIRIPAGFTGVFGIKPGYGLCHDENGLSAMSDFISPGPFARCVADARSMLSVLADKEFSRQALKNKLKVAWCPRPGGRPHDSKLLKAIEQAASILGEAGHDIEEIDLDISGWEAAFNPLVLHNEQRERAHLLDESADLLTGYERRSLETAAELTDEDIDMARQAHQLYREKMHALIARYDVLLCPTTATTAFPITQRPTCIDNTDVHWLWGAFPCTAPFNVSGNPAASLPVALVDGLPVGLQLVTGMNKEGLLMDIAETLEEAIQFDRSILFDQWFEKMNRTPGQEITGILLSRVEDNTLCLSLNRPEKKNALSYELLEALDSALRRDLPGNCRAIIIDAEGSCFSAGADLADLTGTIADLEIDTAIGRVVDAIEKSPVPVIAIVDGACIGAAVDISLACPVRIATGKAWFQVPAVKLGLLYNPDAVARMSKTLDELTLTRVMLQAERIDAVTALQSGVITHLLDTPMPSTQEHSNEVDNGFKETKAAQATRELLQSLYHGQYDADYWQKQRRELLESTERKLAIELAQQSL